MALEFDRTPAGLIHRSEAFLRVAQEGENDGEFNVDAPDLDEWGARVEAVKALLSEREALKTRLRVVESQLKTEARELETRARRHLKRAASSKASEARKTAARVTIRLKAAPSEPHVPTDLLAAPDAAGWVQLKWHRAGNHRGARFVIEKRVGEGWEMVDVIAGTKLKTLAKVGEIAYFQVRARNGRGLSEPSNVAVIYAA